MADQNHNGVQSENSPIYRPGRQLPNSDVLERRQTEAQELAYDVEAVLRGLRLMLHNLDGGDGEPLSLLDVARRMLAQLSHRLDSVVFFSTDEQREVQP